MSVAKIVFEVIALVFKGVEGFIFNFPMISSTFNHHDNIVPINGNIGYPTVTLLFWI